VPPHLIFYFFFMLAFLKDHKHSDCNRKFI
jgi:hypothetical protein